MRALWKGLTAATIGVALLGGGAVSAAPGQGPGMARARMHARAFRAALAKVGLTPEQKARIRATFETSKTNMMTLRGHGELDRAALRTVLAAERPDPMAIGNAMLKVKATREAMRAERQNLHDSTLAVLTPEQRAKFDGYLAALRDVQNFRGARRGGPGAGFGARGQAPEPPPEQ